MLIILQLKKNSFRKESPGQVIYHLLREAVVTYM